MTTPLEPGPNLNTFSELGSNGAAGAAGGIVGTKQLQSAVDQLTTTVTTFEGAVKQISAFTQTLPKAGSSNGSSSAGGSFVNGGGFAAPVNAFAASGGGTNVFGNTPWAVGPNEGQGGTAFAGVPGGTPMGGATVGGTLGTAMTPTGTQGSTTNAGGSTASQPSMWNQFGSALAGATTLLGGYGGNQLSGQIALNTYQFGAQLAMNGGNWTNNQRALAQQAYGTAGGPGPQLSNIWGQNPQDLAQAFSIMGAQAGNPMLNQTSMGRNLLSGTGQFGYLNPAMSGAQSALAMQQLYTPGQSLQMQMLGYGNTPLQQGVPGGTRNMAQFVQGQFQAWNYGGNYGGKPNQSQMAAQLGPNGILYQNLQAEGLNPSQYSSLFLAYNRLFQGNGAGAPGLNANQAQTLMNQLASQSPDTVKNAQAQLANYGIQKNDLDQLKIMAGTQAAKQGDQSTGFTAGVQLFARSVSDFNTGLEKLLNALGLSGIVGGAKGFLGGMGSIGGLGSLGGMGALAYGGVKLAGSVWSKLFGGGGAAAETADAATTTTAGAAGLGALGPLGLGLGAGIGLNWAGNRLTRNNPGMQAQLQAMSKYPGGNIPGVGIATWLGDKASGYLGDAGNFLGGLFGGGASGPGGIPSGSAVPAGTTRNTNTVTSAGVSRQATEAVGAAESQVGVPYVWGGESPGKGFDCSGLTQWAYSRAGVGIPRTSQEQWQFLMNRSVPTNKVEEGDLIFTAGSDGTPDQPGHVAMMISSNKLIQAPYTGADVEIIGYNPGAWSHAARPKGTLSGGVSSSGTSSSSVASSGLGGGFAMAASGMGDTSSEGSTSELSAFQSSVMGGISAGSGYYGNRTGGTLASATSAGTTNGGPVALPGGGTAASNMKIGQKEAAAYGWNTGTQWADLVKLWNQESGWSNTAQNPSSTAYGIAQFLNSTWAAYGPKTSNAGLQIKYGLEYIKGRYGNPSSAWGHEEAFNWYDKGGLAAAGSYGVVGERGPEVVRFGKASEIMNASDSARLMKSAMGPYAGGTGVGLNYSSASPVYSGGAAGRGGGSGAVTLNFNEGSVCINLPQSTGNHLATGANSRMMARQFVEQLSKMNLYEAIASGANS
jgi:cell wall-associated NlpC family hydrolase